MGYNKLELRKYYLWLKIMPLKYKNMPKKITFDEQYEWKKKHLSKVKLDNITSEFEREYREAMNIINEKKNNEKLPAFRKKILKRFKVYKFDDELKTIKNSIFYTCKVKKELEKLFPKFK